MRVWNGDQLRRSSRAGIVERIVFGASATELMPHLLPGRLP